MTEPWVARLQKLSALSDEQRLHCFELLAHNLTIVARVVWSDQTLTTHEQVDSLKSINECLHLVTSRVWVQRLRTHEWTDESFIEMLSSTDAEIHPKLGARVAQAFDWSYSAVES